jgi:hypothetical protein
VAELQGKSKAQTEQIDELHKQMVVSNKMIAVQEQHNKILLAATQAQTHNQLANRIRDKLHAIRENGSLGYTKMSKLEKQLIVFTANKYGWELGEKTTTDDEQLDRRWEDALSALETVTIPSLTYGKASYGNFVK